MGISLEIKTLHFAEIVKLLYEIITRFYFANANPVFS